MTRSGSTWHSDADAQGGRRPVVVVSPVTYNSWPIGKEAGLPGPSFVMPEYVRAVSQQRIADRPLGSATPQTLVEVEWWVTNLTTEPH